MKASTAGNRISVLLPLLLLLPACLIGVPAQAQTSSDTDSVLATGQGLNPVETPDSDPDRALGSAVAVAGRVALIGAPRADGNLGAAYFFVRKKDGTWQQSQKIPDPASGLGDAFGGVVALDRFSALIAGGGVVRYYVLHKGAWRLSQTLESDPGVGAFGKSLALNGCEAFVGVGVAFPNGSAQGGIDVFDRCRHGHWKRVETLMPADSHPNDGFGGTLAVSDREMLVGAAQSGSAYYYVRDSHRWVEVQKILAPSPTAVGFGTAVAFEGRHALIGAPNEGVFDPSAERIGAAYLFKRNGRLWVESARIVPDPAQSSDGVWDGFGSTLAMARGRAAIAAPSAGAFFQDLPGTVYLYELEHGSLEFTESLAGHDFSAGFGQALALSGRTLVVGEPNIRVARPDAFEGTATAYEFPRRDDDD